MNDSLDSIRHWLAGFAQAVRDRDYGAGRRMFDPAVVGFGTVAGRADGLDELVDHQWKHIWDNTEGFDFEYDQLHGEIADDIAWVAVPWSSCRAVAGREPVVRTGRSTIILRKTKGDWRACHTHFSRTPTETGSDDIQK